MENDLVTSVPILNNWKAFSYDQYLQFVDTKRTKYLNDLVNKKDLNPLMYYKNLLLRDEL